MHCMAVKVMHMPPTSAASDKARLEIDTEWKRVGSVDSPHLVRYYGIEFREVSGRILSMIYVFFVSCKKCGTISWPPPRHWQFYRPAFCLPTVQVLSFYGILHERLSISAFCEWYSAVGDCEALHLSSLSRTRSIASSKIDSSRSQRSAMIRLAHGLCCWCLDTYCSCTGDNIILDAFGTCKSEQRSVLLLCTILFRLFLTQCNNNIWQVGDFGSLARLKGQQEALSGSWENFVGTAAFAAPEVIRSSRDVAAFGHKGDVWSLGCVVYEMLTGRCFLLARAIDVLTSMVKPLH